jgi:uncharacterized protein YecT (DUF1311 family)
MQNISFLVIISVLLGCAFFFSQQANFDQRAPARTLTPVGDEESVNDIPACTDDMSQDEKEACLIEAVMISESLVDDVVDRILAMETDTDARISFMDIQYDWEESRDADCSYIRDRIEDPKEAAIKELSCLRDQNLARLNQLEGYYCDWFGGSECQTVPVQGD